MFESKVDFVFVTLTCLINNIRYESLQALYFPMLRHLPQPLDAGVLIGRIGFEVVDHEPLLSPMISPSSPSVSCSSARMSALSLLDQPTRQVFVDDARQKRLIRNALLPRPRVGETEIAFGYP